MISALRCAPFALALCAVQSHTPDAAAEGERFERALKATGLACEASASGLSFKVAFEHEHGRSQTVFASVEAARPGGLILHTIYTTVWVDLQAPPGEELLRKVLTKTKKFGSFYLFRVEPNRWAVRFGTDFDATDLPETSKAGDALVRRLRDTIEFVDRVGEETDVELNGETDVR